jgi:hypothetical protein
MNSVKNLKSPVSVQELAVLFMAQKKWQVAYENTRTQMQSYN